MKLKYITIIIAIIALAGCATTKQKPTVKDPANLTKQEITDLLEYKYGER